MKAASTAAVRILATPRPFGPATQSFEIKNPSREKVTVVVERLGSECFSIPDSHQKLALKPGASARVQVEIHVPTRGMVITLNATYEAVINVWALRQGKGAKRSLVGSHRVTGTGPGFVSLDSLHCFDRTGSPERPRRGRRVR